MTRNLNDDHWLQTFTGQPFYLFDPQPADFDIEVIAHALSMQCRFNGHVKHFWSVAQHSILVMDLLGTWDQPQIVQLVGLLHDSAEAYIGDMIRPLKRALPKYTAIEASIEQSMSQAFGLPFPWPAVVKEADNYALAIERAHLLAKPPRLWRGLPDVDASLYELADDSIETAKNMFLMAYNHLTEGDIS